jgi:integrase
VLGPLASKKEARQAADAHLLQFNAVTRRPQATLTLGSLWSRYFVPEILPVLKFSTRRLYRALATKHLLPEFGGERLCDVARVQIQQFIGRKQRQGYSTQTLAHFRNLLSKLFGVAILWGWMNDNPARGIKLPSMERVRKARVLSVEEIGLLSRSLSDPACIIFKLGVLTGLRIGELLALCVEDLDLVGLRLYVRRNVYCGRVGTTKTKASEREIPLASALVSDIASWLTVRPGRSEWLFPSEAGTPYHDRNLLTRNVHPICDSLGIQRFGWHSLRHYSGFLTMPGVGRTERSSAHY